MERVLVAFGLCLAGTPGCAVHWYDEQTGTEHIWGFGHLAVRVTEADDSGVRAVVRESSSIGLGAGVHESGGHAVIGYHSDRRMQIRNDTSVWIGWTGDSLFRTRVGAMPPWWEGVPDQGAAPSDWDHERTHEQTEEGEP